MRELDGIRIIGADDGPFSQNPKSVSRELVTSADTNQRWRLGEVTARADASVATHLHPGEPEALIILEGNVELHGSHGIAQIGPGDIVFIPPDTEHGLRTPEGGRWLAIWPNQERVPGPRYAD